MTSGMTPLTASASRHAGHPSQRALQVRCLIGAAIAPELAAIARLRATVLQAWPDLHDGDAAGELTRLEACATSWRSLAVLVFDGDRMVGASLGLPLDDADGKTTEKLRVAAGNPGVAFLLAGSVLLPAYRGRRLGHRFFDERETHTRSLGGFEATVFPAVERNQDDPRRPPFGRSHESFWQRRGYARKGVAAVGSEDGGLLHAVWVRPLERGF